MFRYIKIFLILLFFVNTIFLFGRTQNDDPIFEVIRKHDIGKVKEILKERPNAIKEKTLSGKCNPLHIAMINYCDSVMIKTLIDAGVNINEKDKMFGGYTAFYYANIYSNHYDAAEKKINIYLEKYMKEKNVLDKEQYKEFLDSANLKKKQFSNAKECYELLKPYEDARREMEINSSMWKLLGKHDVAGVEKMLKNGTDIHMLNKNQQMPMDIALLSLDTPMIEMLLIYTSFNYSSYKKIDGIYKLLAENLSKKKEEALRDYLSNPQVRKKINAYDGTGTTLFVDSIRKGISLGEVKVYLDAGADPKAKDRDKNSLVKIYYSQNKELLEDQKMFKDFIKSYRKNKKTPLLYPEINCYLPEGKILPPLSAIDYKLNMKQAIWQAIKDESVDSVKLWLKEGGDVNLQSNDDETPLMKAVKTFNAEIVKTLLDNGADPTLRKPDGSTPCEIFCTLNRWKKRVESETKEYMIVELIEFYPRAKVKDFLIGKDKNKDMRFIELVKTGDKANIKLFLDAGFGLDYKDKEGRPVEDVFNTKNPEIEKKKQQLKKLLDEYANRPAKRKTK